ncbi:MULTISPECIES: hypothetical protein [Comamonas]|uniref:hypothetical protein n=1 Tax=Comamonas TaxID=283 RepID=UPI0015F80500|nr:MULTISPECIES: hypothetical protein [Comamonas]UUC92406.1 hypothetical protein NOX35_19275 [Comamonas sp. C11]WEE76425.1 hypothetical protein LZ683_20090 [Comamonas testosteroni]
MSIAVFYLRNSEPEGQTPVWQPQCRAFSDAQMGEALALCQQLRKDERNAHVVISSELRDMVGPVGVSAVEDGKTPDGFDYQWSKAGRAGASRKNAAEAPRRRQDMDN